MMVCGQAEILFIFNFDEAIVRRTQLFDVLFGLVQVTILLLKFSELSEMKDEPNKMNKTI